MRSVLPIVLALAAVLPACATSPTVTTETGATPPPSCASIARQAAQRVEAVAAGQRACSSDADCVVVPQGSSCFDHCTTSIARAGQPALAAIVADVDARECRDFAAQSCRVEVPPCAPPRAAGCHAGQCE
jgi:hypothetical protein